MPKKTFYIRCLLAAFALLVMAPALRSQVNISLPAANIQNGTAYTSSQPAGTYSPAALFPSLLLRGTSPILLQTASSSSFPVSNLGYVITSIGGINLLGGTTAISISTTAQTVYAGVLSLAANAPVQANFTIPVSGYAWVAGTYTTTLISSSVPGGSATGPGLLTLTVPAYIAAPATIPTITLNVNSLTYYSSATISAASSMTIGSTVPFNMGIRANSGNFTYSNSLGLANPANLSVGNVLTNINSGTNTALSGTTQNLTATPISVATNNSQTQTLNVSIPPASLTSQFVQTGTYSVPLTITTSDGRTSPTATSQTTTSTLTVTVADMQAFSVNDATTTLTFANTAAYQAGVSQSMPAHLTVSSTSPWGISVTASAVNLTNGANTIPVNYVSIDNTSGQTLLTSTTLSAVSQAIASSQPAVIAKPIGVNYSISAANAQQLIAKAGGTYSVTVTYTLSAL